MKKGLYILILAFLPIMGRGQTRVFINSGYITLGISGTAVKANPTYFIIHNPASNAITYTSGGIVSEKEWGMLWWDIGAPASAITYTVPFAYSNITYVPLTVSLATGNGGTASGAGTGTLLFSTWHGTTSNCNGYGANIADNGCYMPSDVTNMYPATSVSSPSATDDSYYVADRFWVIDANTGYSTKPSPIITFSYINSGSSEVTAPNVFTETDLAAQRFNSTSATWGDMNPSGTDNNAAGTNIGSVTTSLISSSDFFRSWVLASTKAPLPITLTSYTAECDSNRALIQWTSATESNNDHYILDKSADGVNYQTVAIVKGAGTSSTPNNYSFTDQNPYTGTSYYKLSQTDFDGTTTAKGIIPFTGCTSASNTIEAHNVNEVINININAIASDNYTIILVDILGQPIITENHSVSPGYNIIRLHTNVSAGIYILTVKNDKMNYNRKLFIGK